MCSSDLLDLCLAKDHFDLDERSCQKMIQIIMKMLISSLVIPEDKELVVHFFFIVRPQSTPIRKDGTVVGFKHGVHILIPSVQTTRPFKKYMLGQLRKSSQFMTVLSGLGVVGSPNSIDTMTDCVDFNSASVPVLFLGSSKRGGLRYELQRTFRVSGMLEDFVGDGLPMISQVAATDLHRYHLV